MSATAFDTYAAAKTLREAGFDERQAEAAVAVMRDAITEGVATKADIKDVTADVARLEDKIEAMERTFKAGIKAAVADLKADMLKVAIGIVFANVGLTFALLKMLLPAGTP